MLTGFFNAPTPGNEPIKDYYRNSVAKEELTKELERQSSSPIEIPLYIGSEEIKSKSTKEIKAPHNHSLTLGTYSTADKESIHMAIESAKKASKTWSKMPFEDRAAIFLKAAALISEKYRETINAATMLCQSKTHIQAEIDSACELIDFWRFNVEYMQQIYQNQPPISTTKSWNRLEYRPLEGFVYAITPFNFTAIAANLPTAPALMGNTVVWKPASSAMLATYYIMAILKEAGLPDGVINMIPGKGSEISSILLDHPDLAGVHFTGSTKTFNAIWSKIGENTGKGLYKNYPRVVGETGGKDFVVAHKDASIDNLVKALRNGAFEYQGQKCSAASRAYISKSIWPEVQKKLKAELSEIHYGDVSKFDHFGGAVIDKKSYDNIVSYIEHAKNAKDAKIICGGDYSDKVGYFVNPTIIETTNPKFKSMEEEIFGPVLTVYPYDDNKLDETLDLLDETSPYALTGAIFARDRAIVKKMTERLVNCAGNFYVNDKPTGAVVGQQPFGGSRASGTNDKAGSYLNLLRWVSPRTIKETFIL